LSVVHPDDKQKFTDNSIGLVGIKNKCECEFEFRLMNVNTVKETYEIIGHTEDYKITNHPILITGTTQLIQLPKPN